MEERWERRRRREREPGDWWGAINGIGFLVIILLTISQYPDVFVLLSRYFQSWGTYGYPVLPGRQLGQVIVYLLTVSGIWGLVSAALRFAFTNSLSRPARDIVGALFALYMANSFTQFYAGTIHGTGLVVAFFIGLIAVVIANALIAYFVPRRQRSYQSTSF
jgi:hypothetical protein